MEREQVIALAREAGFDTDAIALDIFMTCKLGKLERFAALVEQRVRSEIALEELAKISQELGGY